MEIRASYVIVGSVVMALLAGLAAFSLWLVEAGVDRDVARYEIAFAGSVSGLQEGGQVLYRGIPVGRVAEIRIDPDNPDLGRVTVVQALPKGEIYRSPDVAPEAKSFYIVTSVLLFMFALAAAYFMTGAAAFGSSMP